MTPQEKTDALLRFLALLVQLGESGKRDAIIEKVVAELKYMLNVK